MSRLSASIEQNQEHEPKRTYQENQFNCGHEMMIRELFWMQGEYIIVLSNQKKTHDYYLELFHFKQKNAIDKVKVYSSQANISISLRHNQIRNYTSLVIRSIRLGSNIVED